MKRSISGFTMVELLIVITVIAILAIISVVAYNGVQLRAKATAVAHSLEDIDNRFQTWASYTELKRWPPDYTSGGGSNLQDLTTTSDPLWTKFSNYMPKIPPTFDTGTDPWFYDQDDGSGGDPLATYNYCLTNSTTPACTADDKTPCSTTEAQKLTGVNIVIKWFQPKDEQFAKLVNDIFDGASEANWKNCGKVRWYQDTVNNRFAILYSISYTKQLAN